MPTYPSTQALRAFEAAVRHQSFSRAAEELGITHGAVSHRIRKLEDMAGAALFERAGNQMIPTATGRTYVHTVRHALDLMAGLFPERPVAGAERIRISVLPSFASHWLIPRLGAFHARHPGVQVELDARLELARIGPGHVDAAIRHGQGQWAGCRARRLVGETIFPVCSAAYRDAMAIVSPQDLARCRLLRHSFQPWKPWLTLAGVDLPEPGQFATYDDAGLLLNAAIAGDGVVLTRSILAADALAAGQVVRLFDAELLFFGAYYFARARQRSPLDAALDAFEQWLAETLPGSDDAKILQMRS